MNVTDPVCGMSIESGNAAAAEHYQEKTFHFCSTHCRDAFKADPARYAAKEAGKDGARVAHGGHERGGVRYH